MKKRLVSSLLFLTLVLAACAPAAGQPKFERKVLPSATSIPMPKSAQVAIQLPQRIASFDVSPNNKLLAVATDQGALLYKLPPDKPVRTLNNGEFTSRLAWSPDGSKLAVGGSKDYGKPFFTGGDSTNSWKAHLTVWDTATWKIIFEPEFGNEMVNQSFYEMAWSPDGRLLAFSTDVGGVQVMNVETGRTVSRQADFAATVTAIAWSPDGTRLLANHDMAHGMRRWRLGDGRVVRLFDARSSNYMSLAWSPDGRRIASGDGQGGLCFWTASTNKCDSFIHAHRTATFSLAWSPDGSQVATGGGVIRLWDTHTGALMRSFGEDSGFIYEKLQWLAAQDIMVASGISITGSPGSVLRLWKISNGALIAEFRGG